MEENISAGVFYKSFSQNEDSSNNLSKFVSQAENFNLKNSSYDMVKDYLNLSGNCQEMLPFVKDLSNLDSQQAMIVLKAMCHILIRVASDMDKYVTAGTNIVNEILSYGMGAIFNSLKIKQKSSRTKVALHLLSSMVALGNPSAAQVIAKLDFSHVNFTHLLYKSNCTEEEDCRTAFLNFIVLIISICDHNIIRQIVEVKGFLNNVFPGLVSDNASTITLVLNTFRSKIIENIAIPKTCKVRLFNEYSLKPVIDLLTWKGPIKIKKYMKRKLGEDDKPIVYEATEDEAREVHTYAYEFLISLCCSYKYGIIFRDLTFGTSGGRNFNHVITNVLKFVVQPYTDQLTSKFVISVLKACPDQFKHYMPLLKDKFVPRLSTTWVKAIDFFKKVMQSLDVSAYLFKSGNRKSVAALINIARIYCLPELINTSTIVEMFSVGHPILCYYICSYLSSILMQVKSVLDFCSQPPTEDICYKVSELSTFQQTFVSSLLRNLRVAEMLQNFWIKITSEEFVLPEDEADKDLEIPTLSDQLLAILELMKLFLEAFPNLSGSDNFNFFQMLGDAEKCASLSNKEFSLVSIKLLDLLTAQKREIMEIGKGENSFTQILAILHVYLRAHDEEEKSAAVRIIRKFFWHTKLFDYCKWEIDVWIDAIQNLEARKLNCTLEFLSMSLNSSFQRPNHLLFETFKTGDSNFISEPKDALKMLNDLMADDDSENGEIIAANEEINSAHLKQCFSSLVPGVLHTLKNREYFSISYQVFVEQVLTSILHHQYATDIFFDLINQYKEKLSSSFYMYSEMLHSLKSQSETASPTKNYVCDLDLINHLKQKFISAHFYESSMCSCKIVLPPEGLDHNLARKVIWQLLTYINFELKWLYEHQDKQCTPIYYLDLLEQVYNSLEPCSEDRKSITRSNIVQCMTKDDEKIQLKLEVLKEILEHPIMHKLFLEVQAKDENLSKKANKSLKNFVRAVTKTILNISQIIISLGNQTDCTHFERYKQKVVIYIQQNLNNLNCNDFELDNIIGTFSAYYSGSEITLLLENLLSLENSLQQSESLIPLLILLTKQYLQSKEFIALSPGCINSLALKFGAMSNKQKKLFKSSLLQIFLKHHPYALSVQKDSFWLLLQHRSDKDLYILGALIEFNKELRQLTQLLLIETIEDSANIGFFFLVSRCLVMTDIDDKNDQNFKISISDTFWEILTKVLREELIFDLDYFKESKGGEATQLLLREKVISAKKLNKFCKLLLQSSEESVPSPLKMKVLLQLLEIWKEHKVEQNKSLVPVLQILFRWMTSTLTKNFKHWDLISFIKTVLQEEEVIKEVDVTDLVEVIVFFQKALKISMMFEDVGKVVIQILTLLCEKSKGVNLPIQGLYNLVMGHSSFFQVLLSDVKCGNSLKERIVELLTALAQLDGSVCKEQHISVFLGAYSGTISSIDQKLLYLMKVYSDNGINMIKYCPFLWGKAAITHYSLMNNETHQHLLKQAKLRDIASIISPEKIENTILHYPLKMTLQPSLDNVEDVDENLVSNIYDLRFFLPLLAKLLSPGSFVNINCFIESRLLMLIFTSLSSYDSNLRALGYYCLSQFYQHLESLRSKEKDIWIYLLDSVRNSIASPNPKLACIITLFLARTADIFSKPTHSMYGVLYKFIMVKPSLDVTQVPEFYKLFNSLEIENRMQRLWLLNLIADGLRTTLDFHICEKRYIFSTIQSFYWSSVATQQEKIAILHIISSAVKIEPSAKTLCQNGLLLWLHSILEQGEITGEISIKVNAIVKDLIKIQLDSSSINLMKKLKEDIFDAPLPGTLLSSSSIIKMDLS